MIVHMMNSIEHESPDTVGIDGRGLDQRVQPLLPAKWTMGDTCMGEGAAEQGLDEGPGGSLRLGSIPDLCRPAEFPGFSQFATACLSRKFSPERSSKTARSRQFSVFSQGYDCHKSGMLPFDFLSKGGPLTIVKTRTDLASYDKDPG